MSIRNLLHLFQVPRYDCLLAVLREAKSQILTAVFYDVIWEVSWLFVPNCYKRR